MIIDGENLILGRLASYAAKKALLGEKVDIINCEKIVISGRKKAIFLDLKERYARGEFIKGPFPSRRCDRFVRRTIRGMLPYNQYKGKSAFKRVMCYRGIPDKFKNEKHETVEKLNIVKTKSLKYINLKLVEKFLGYGQN
ncbi:50S ribosomal protein L13 [Candidatus Woesearchaeota archaeon]|nr:50S ribosomal protein L13 [Candidatus Woesearchaeota archaeon]